MFFSASKPVVPDHLDSEEVFKNHKMPSKETTHKINYASRNSKSLPQKAGEDKIKSRSRNYKKMSGLRTYDSKLSFSKQSTRLNTIVDTYASRPWLSLSPSFDKIDKN